MACYGDSFTFLLFTAVPIWAVPHFPSIYLLSLSYGAVPHSGDEIAINICTYYKNYVGNWKDLGEDEKIIFPFVLKKYDKSVWTGLNSHTTWSTPYWTLGSMQRAEFLDQPIGYHQCPLMYDRHSKYPICDFLKWNCSSKFVDSSLNINNLTS
jgi:hypothetical protein